MAAATTLHDVNKEYDRWVKNAVLSPGDSEIIWNKGNCTADHHFNYNNLKAGDRNIWTNNQKGAFNHDYYACGAIDEGGHGHCLGLKETEWKHIWSNCKSSKGTNYDPCNNMVTNDGKDGTHRVKTNFNVGWQTRCNDKTQYDPVNDKCTRDCGVDSKCSIGAKNQAYPTKQQDLRNTESLPDWRGFKTDKGPTNTNSCPSTHTREFSCAGDGYPNIRDKTPGCGSGGDVDGIENTIRFCARPKPHWSTTSLAGCCLGNKRNTAKSDNLYPSKECGREYCRSFVAVSDGKVDDKCEQPFKIGDKLGCYRMSSKCNTMFKDACNAKVFLNSRICRDGTQNCDDDKKVVNQLHTYCKKWAKIQPTEFYSIAQSICKLPVVKDSSGNEITDDGGEALIKKMKTVKGRGIKNDIKKLFQSELCRPYITTNLETMRPTLQKLCKAGVKKLPNGKWIVTNFGKEFSNICPCFYPNEFYEDYKKKLKEQFEKEGNFQSNMLQADIACLYTPCTASRLFDLEAVGGSCPGIGVCIQKINQKVTVAGGPGLGKMSPPRRLPTAGNQACNIKIINSSTGSTADTSKGSGVSSPTTKKIDVWEGTIPAGLPTSHKGKKCSEAYNDILKGYNQDVTKTEQWFTFNGGANHGGECKKVSIPDPNAPADNKGPDAPGPVPYNSSTLPEGYPVNSPVSSAGVGGGLNIGIGGIPMDKIIMGLGGVFCCFMVFVFIVIIALVGGMKKAQ